MFDFRWEAARLAAELARAATDRAVVCLGCTLVGESHGRGQAAALLTLSKPPLDMAQVELGRLLLVVSLDTVSANGYARQCAEAEVPEFWRFDLEEGLVERLYRPIAGLYRRRVPILPGEATGLVALPGVRVIPLLAAFRNG
ncbi:MAG: hypothetical protein WD273_00515 [Trueperaceae bacterium]